MAKLSLIILTITIINFTNSQEHKHSIELDPVVLHHSFNNNNNLRTSLLHESTHGTSSHHFPTTHHHHNPHPPPQAPHWTKYWSLNNKRKIKRKRVHKKKVANSNYLIELTEKLLDGIGILPEYGSEKNMNKGWHKHGHYVFKGITLHHGLYTSVI